MIDYPSNHGRLYFFNFSPWRMSMIGHFFEAPGNEKHICKSLEDALNKGLTPEDKIFLFGIKHIPGLIEYAEEHDMPIHRIEDGFIRSVGLGSALAKPHSLCVDATGIHFDPKHPSDLENMLQNTPADAALLARARKVRETIVSARLSKYNHLRHATLSIDRSRYDKVILVAGQVADDASMNHGSYGLSYAQLLPIVRENNPHSYIIYKPHPDVLSGNRIGHIPREITDRYADLVVTDLSIDSAIAASDEVHIITSTVGLDALIRQKKVFTYGMPFYAGWGLTTDYRRCRRRTRRLSLDELIAIAMILYPRYTSPKNGAFCEIEQTLEELKIEQEKYFSNKTYRILSGFKGYILPKSRKILRKILEPIGLEI